MDKQKRVVLSLKKEHAEALNYFIKTFATSANTENQENVTIKISKRINRGLNRIKILEGFKEKGIEPTKELIKTAMNSAEGK